VDAEARAEAVAGLDPSEDAELATLAELVTADPSPLVRAEAARQLGNEASLFSTMSLLGALEDLDPYVVAAAIEALEFSAGASIAPQLEPLLAHRSPAVREAAASAIEFLE